MARRRAGKAPKRANPKPRRKARRRSEAVIHQGILTDEQIAYL
jgi:hypothetical protein